MIEAFFEPGHISEFIRKMPKNFTHYEFNIKENYHFVGTLHFSFYTFWKDSPIFQGLSMKSAAWSRLFSTDD